MELKSLTNGVGLKAQGTGNDLKSNMKREIQFPPTFNERKKIKLIGTMPIEIISPMVERASKCKNITICTMLWNMHE